jgi:hypothetical protein
MVQACPIMDEYSEEFTSPIGLEKMKTTGNVPLQEDFRPRRIAEYKHMF